MAESVSIPRNQLSMIRTGTRLPRGEEAKRLAKWARCSTRDVWDAVENAVTKRIKFERSNREGLTGNCPAVVDATEREV